MEENQRLICPKCSSWHFGSYMLPDGKLQRVCHDQHGRGCRFEWHQDDDYKYLYTVTVEKGVKQAREAIAEANGISTEDFIALRGEMSKMKPVIPNDPGVYIDGIIEEAEGKE